ncbi:MAG TPA: Rieske 2Fe-2S domain-containing protein [Stellaceae bacterium]|jgi:DMSO/TMAO reductase YedYZ heme-binding membrane subunit/nitrite reductase/ring-hydroxylating ferredoxin subunit
MSTGYRAVQWNRQKIVYDAVMLASIAIYIAAFVLVGRYVLSAADDPAEWDDLFIRAFGSCAFLLLTLILSIGPLARLDPRFLVLLYNRRHLGVTMFATGAIHASLIVDWFWSRGKIGDLGHEITDWPKYRLFVGFPFETLGITALTILFLMAITSHDFWLRVLSPPFWKALHMAVYLAYGLLVLHIALGVMQNERSPLIPALLGGAFLWVGTLHLIAGRRERALDRGEAGGSDGWLAVGPPASIADGRAKIVAAPNGERIAIYRDGATLGALTNLCAHQNGPLGEGRIIDGCVTCPWHGYQYRLEDGCAPPPFTEKLATYRLRLSRGIVEVNPRPLAPGTPAALVCPSI